MFSMNFKEKCFIKFASLPKLEPSRNVSPKVIKFGFINWVDNVYVI